MEEKHIQDLGRAGFINELSGSVSFKTDKVIKGIGDDTAVLEKDETTFTLVTTETMVEGVAFDLAYTPFYQVGAKVITAAVSDIYAMNGQPIAVFVNLAIPNRVTMEMVQDLYKGITMATDDYKCQLAGGDVTGSHNALVISVTAYGEVKKNKITYNQGAQKGHAICITGDLGSAYAGLKVLLREKKHWEDSKDPVMQPDLTPWDYVVKRQLLPVAQKEFISLCDSLNLVPSSMIDISQGLVYEIKRILNASKCGAYLYQAAIPVDLQTRSVADEMKDDVDTYALYGGEDFEMLFTLSEKNVEKLAKSFKNFSVIGKISEEQEGFSMQTAEGDVVTFEN